MSATLLRTTPVAATLMAVALCATHIVNIAFFGVSTLDLNVEGSLLTFGAAAMFALVSVLAATVALIDDRSQVVWLSIAAVALLFALEEGAVGAHEALEHQTSISFGIFVSLAFLIALTWWLVRFWSSIPKLAATLLLSAAAVVVLAQLAGAASILVHGTAKDLLGAVEECGEIAVALLGVWAVRAGTLGPETAKD